MLTGDGVIASNDAYFTLSFAEDGVLAAGQQSALNATFDPLGEHDAWRQVILDAFQAWAQHTNADIGLRSDGGQSFGTAGATRRDERFGDIRIGAIELDPSIGAVSVPSDGVVGGTWLGDVLFNTAFPYQNLDDLFAVALHEAGNVFGLEDNDNPDSPLFTGSLPTALGPTASDIADLQALYGVRSPDRHESPDEGPPQTNNSSFATAKRVELNEDVLETKGAVPSLLYADITTPADVDFYRLPTPEDYAGPITFELRSEGISLLAPRLRVFDTNQQLVTQIESADTDGDRLAVTVDANLADRQYYAVVDAASSESNNVGGYSLTATFETVNTLDPTLLESYADGSLRRLDDDQLESVLAPDEEDFFDNEIQLDETAASANPLESEDDFPIGTRFETSGAILEPTDRDFYKIETPPGFAEGAGNLTIAIRSTIAGGLIPRVTAQDDQGTPFVQEVLLNGGGELVVQVSGIQPDQDVTFFVEADDPSGSFAVGNYELSAAFSEAPLQLDDFAGGTLNPTDAGAVHRFYVAQPQIFHFVLGASPGASLGGVIATVRDAEGVEVQRIVAPLGQARSAEAVLLPPGEYTVEVSSVSLNDAITAPIDYTLRGAAISDPFAADPDDPASHPFACEDPALSGFFCYPGDFVSADPFLWEDFIESLPQQAPRSLNELVDLLIGDWWSWVWEQTGLNGPALAQNDRVDVPINVAAARSLRAASLTGAPNVLTNDVEPEGDAVVAVLLSDPEHGTLRLDPDGTVNYTPNPGFIGVDRFTYAAYDFRQNSAPGTAYLVVGSGITGDYNSDGVVDRDDVDAWRAALGSTESLLADGNKNLVVDVADYAVWRDTFAAAGATPPAAARNVEGPADPALQNYAGLLALSQPVRGPRKSVRDQVPAIATQDRDHALSLLYAADLAADRPQSLRPVELQTSVSERTDATTEDRERLLARPGAPWRVQL